MAMDVRRCFLMPVSDNLFEGIFQFVTSDASEFAVLGMGFVVEESVVDRSVRML